MRICYYLIALTLLINLNTSFAQTSQNPADSGPKAAQETTTTQNGQQITIQTVYCPPPSELVKNGLYWGTPTGGWKSYGESFDKEVATFIGAQWVGINVGKMMCIYKGNLKMSFPIIIQNDTLSQVPSGHSWGSDLGGYRNCHSTNMEDCPFIVKKQKVNIQQIYDTLDFFKGKPSPLNESN